MTPRTRLRPGLSFSQEKSPFDVSEDKKLKRLQNFSNGYKFIVAS